MKRITPLKKSETPEDQRAKRQTYIQTRWGQLSDLSTNWADEAIKYLLIVNTGAMAASLGFIGTMAHLRSAQWPKVALSLFAAGVVLVGVYHAVRYHRVEWLFKGWRNDVASYSDDKLNWNELLNQDEARVKQWSAPLYVLAYTSFLCFLFGLVVTANNFSDITTPTERSSAHESPQKPDTTSITGPKESSGSSQGRTAPPASTRQEHRNTKGAGTGS